MVGALHPDRRLLWYMDPDRKHKPSLRYGNPEDYGPSLH